MLKKIIASVIAAASLFIGSQFNTTEAYIAKDQLVLGGIKVPTRAANVRNIYGSPTKSDEYNTVWYYGDTVSISLEEGNPVSITVLANNGWKTSAGLSVGMNISDAKRLYGNPDRSKSKDNKIVYTYLVPSSYNRGYFDGMMYMMCDQSGKIRLLRVSTSTMADLDASIVSRAENYLLDNYYW